MHLDGTGCQALSHIQLGSPAPGWCPGDDREWWLYVDLGKVFVIQDVVVEVLSSGSEC